MSSFTKKINIDDLVPMDIFTDDYPIIVDLVYADENHKNNVFGKIYDDDALLWLHKDMAKIVLLASFIVHNHSGGKIIIYDGLRTVDAQKITARNKDIQPRLIISKPGGGGHPRGMAVDISMIDKNGNNIDMGTDFDFLADDPEILNPAARNYPDISAEVKENRKFLENAMLESAKKMDMDLFPLPLEWWDFRFMPETIKEYAPLHEIDLHPYQKMINLDIIEVKKIKSGDFSPALDSAINEVIKDSKP